MRIGILADPLDFQQGGIHYYTDGLIKGLMELEPHHEIILFRAKEDNNYDFTQVVIPEGLTIFGYDVKRKFYDIPRLIQRMSIDVVFEPAHFGPFNLPKTIKRITMIHDLTPILFPQWHTWGSSLLQRIFLPLILKRADLILANSQHTSSDIKKYKPKLTSRVREIHLGLSREFHEVEIEQVERPSNLARPYILFVSTIEPRKNLITLLKAFENYKDKVTTPDILVICGAVGWKAKKIIHEIQGHKYKNDIVCTQYVDRTFLISLYTHAEVFVYPSLYEGFGLPMIEALACGTQVIAANNSCLPEVGRDYVKYFETLDYIELANLIDNLRKSDDSPQLIRKRMEYARSFSWKDYAEKFIAELELLV